MDDLGKMAGHIADGLKALADIPDSTMVPVRAGSNRDMLETFQDVIERATRAEADLKTVLDREAESHRRHDEKVERLEAEKRAVQNAAQKQGVEDGNEITRLRGLLEKMSYQYENQDLNHVDFRIWVKEVVDAALQEKDSSNG